jgi:uncharacterized protein YeaO (DUF488 family)
VFAGPTTGRVSSVDGRDPDGSIRVDLGSGPVVKRDVDIVRVYDNPGRQGDDYRVLVDRLWPRGQSKDAIDHDEWVKDATPSTELRQWYGHDPARFAEFARRHRAELEVQAEADVISQLRKTSEVRRLVLLTATRDIEHSGATVLRKVIGGADHS